MVWLSALRMRRTLHLIVLAFSMLWLGGLHGAVTSFRLDLPGIALGGVAVEGISVRVDEGRAEIHVRRVVAGDRLFSDLSLKCGNFALDANGLRCEQGELDLPDVVGQAQVRFEYDFSSQALSLMIEGDTVGALRLVNAHNGIEAEWTDFALAPWLKILPPFEHFDLQGKLSGTASLRADGGAAILKLSTRLSEGGFASADGLRAGEALTAVLSVNAVQDQSGWQVAGRLGWSEGAAYVHPVYIEAGAALEFAAHLTASELVIDQFNLALPGVDVIALRGRIALPDLRISELSGAVSRADLALVGPTFISPLIAPARAESLRYAGHVSLGFELQDDRLSVVNLALSEVGISDLGAGLSFGPVSGALPWRRDQGTDVWLDVEGGRWQKLELGAFRLRGRVMPDQFDVAVLTIPVLDGALVLKDLSIRHEQGAWQGSAGAVIEPISMTRLTEAIGLPVMSGVLSASMPRLSYAPGELVLDGALVISVFDGYLQVTNLSIQEPLGVGSVLLADVQARALDLFKLTETFSFGSITGLVDIDIAGLQLAHWKPVRFDARLVSSPGRYRKRISQRAVENISALGGAGAVAALQRGVLGFFESFGYSALGFSCRLEGNVCIMSGLEGEGAATATLIRGGGVPSLDVIGYNRRVDWNELIERIQAVIESNAAPVIN